MTENLTRKYQKIFAQNAGAQGKTVFGSTAQGNTQYTTDIDAMQSEAYENGFADAVVSKKAPVLQDFNTVENITTRQLAYLFQKGIPEWNNETTYFKGNVILNIENDVPVLYYSLIDNNLNNQVSDSESWNKLDLGKELTSNSLFDFKFTDHLLNDASWVNADDFSWLSGETYQTAYNHLLSDIQGKTINNETISNTTISYYLADDGHKIVDVANISQVEELFNSTGVAWYYILDTTNQQFKLPRTNWGFVGLRNNVGEYVEESLPNISGSVNSITQGNDSFPTANGALKITNNGNAYQTGSTNYMKKAILAIDASLASSTYKNNAPVQQKATQMYLYFYVGNFTREAIEETAGLNSELFNNKADRDLNNLNTDGQEKITNLVAPSNRYIDLTLGENGSEYTAPANGWFFLEKSGTASDQWITITCGVLVVENSSAANRTRRCSMYVGKGAKVTINYNVDGTTKSFKFIYANGN